ncbi:MAG: ATP-binding protein [Bacteroidales bacterium]|nr:ATP-binding protein [Bacteroidales bacterium]
MVDITNEIEQIIGNDESNTLEYKAVLPPSKSIAKLICSFANTEGGYIILGVSDNKEINGLSEDFRANSITHKAVDLLSPKPNIHYQYVMHKGKKLYAIKIEKAQVPILLEGKVLIRIGATTQFEIPQEISFSQSGYERISEISNTLVDYSLNGTN